jgi:hypothetical protein
MDKSMHFVNLNMLDFPFAQRDFPRILGKFFYSPIHRHIAHADDARDAAKAHAFEVHHQRKPLVERV